MKLLLYMYELMSGLKINFNKSEVILIYGDDEPCLIYAEIFNCHVGKFPIKYLGGPCKSKQVACGRLDTT